jgi:hypothetical protein
MEEYSQLPNTTNQNKGFKETKAMGRRNKLE